MFVYQSCVTVVHCAVRHFLLRNTFLSTIILFLFYSPLQPCLYRSSLLSLIYAFSSRVAGFHHSLIPRLGSRPELVLALCARALLFVQRTFIICGKYLGGSSLENSSNPSCETSVCLNCFILMGSYPLAGVDLYCVDFQYPRPTAIQ